jgi:hypothetical protein
VRLDERIDSNIAELLVPGGEGAEARHLIFKAQKHREGESRPPAERAAHEYAVLEMLSGGEGALAVPRPIALEGSSIVMERAGGERLDQIVRASRSVLSAEAEAAVEAAGEWLRRFQQKVAARGESRELAEGIADRARQNAAAAGIATPELEKTISRLCREAAKTPVVGHHGDFWPGNIFFDGRTATVIDFEGFRESLRWDDAAYFLVHLKFWFVLPTTASRYELLHQRFLASFAPDGVDAGALEFHLRAKALELLATGRFEGLRGAIRRRVLLRAATRGEL